MLRRAPDTVRRSASARRLRDELRVSAARDPRFLRVVVPSAPWVFGCAGVAYAVLPNLVAGQVGELRVAFSALVTVVTLGAGVLVQPLARRLDGAGAARSLSIGLLVTAAGMVLATLAARSLAVPLVLVAAALLGVAYGINLVAGLRQVQRIAAPHELAGLTAVYYALTYVGFAAPAVLSLLAPTTGIPPLLAIGAVIALASSRSIARARP